MERLTIQDLASGVFATSVKPALENPSAGGKGSAVSSAIAALPNDSRGTLDIPISTGDPVPGPLTREDLGKQINLIA